jgi:hypothetical protein
MNGKVMREVRDTLLFEEERASCCEKVLRLHPFVCMIRAV